MSKNKAILGLFVACLLLNTFSLTAEAQTEIKTPTITEIIQTGVNLTLPIVKGQTPHNTEVLIYLDGSFIGLAEIEGQTAETDSFSLTVPKHLKSATHYIFAVARDKTSLRLSAPSAERPILIENISAPTLISPNTRTISGQVKPVITGLTKNDTKVHIYIDGKLNGKTDWLSHVSGTANFAYRPFLNLSVGYHSVTALAEDRLGRTSRISETKTFRVFPATPAPTLIKVVSNKVASNKPLITGLTKNDTIVKVYVDKKAVGEFPANNHKSGTANFAYIPAQALTKGKHFVYTVAYDSIGKESTWSNIVYFNVGQGTEPKITPEAVTEKPSISVTPIKEEKTDKAKPVEEVTKPEIKDQDIKTILEKEKSTTTPSGSINESRKLQGKPQMNLVIFILFLIAVIIWIFWVNRELIREKREQEKAEKKD